MKTRRPPAQLRADLAAIRALLERDAPADAALSTLSLRAELRRDGGRGPALHRACAAVHHCAQATLGLTPFDTQWLAALAMLDGRLAEMATGEGKTLALALAACVAALAGRQVHVITANDYLVQRDAQTLLPLFKRFGLDVGTVVGASGAGERHVAYRKQVVYVTARELVFDSLRDAQAAGPHALPLQHHANALAGAAAQRQLLSALDVALIDEADSILLDEAQMPLILSRPVHDRRATDALADAWSLAMRLQAGIHFEPGTSPLRPCLTTEGQGRIERLAEGARSAWFNRNHRTELVERALAALHGLQRDRDYLVRNGEVVLIDAVTGRAAPGRMWTQGLHELVALKEGCPVPVRTEPVSQLIYPRFFRRYRHLAGMSGTLANDAPELQRLYGLAIVAVPLRRPSRRQRWASRVFDSAESRWQAVAQRAAQLAATGRPVLIGTDSVADSQALATHLQRAGCEFALLNAAQDAHEARIVADAGRAGRITVATNMAGRGTDIALAAGVSAAGGLHVLSCQDNRSRRLDRQLAGRCARQGDPGSVEHWRVWSERELEMSPLWRALCTVFRKRDGEQYRDVPPWLADAAFRLRQAAAERRAMRDRRRLIELDRIDQDSLRFALPAE